jgi:hypothetical protein
METPPMRVVAHATLDATKRRRGCDGDATSDATLDATPMRRRVRQIGDARHHNAARADHETRREIGQSVLLVALN